MVSRSASAASVAAPSPANGEPAVLQRDLGRFLVDLSIALHKFAMYPAGHPSLEPVMESLARRTEALLQDRPRFAVGVARDRLVIEGVVTDERHPLLCGLADRLHHHHLAALSFYRGVTMGELAQVVMAIAEDPKWGNGPLGTRQPGRMPSWPHVSLHPLTVGCLEIVAGREGDGVGPVRSAELWVGLAQAALGRDPVAAGPPVPTEPAVVAKAIDEHQPVEAYDQVIVGYLQQISEEVRTSCSPDALELRRRVSTLVSAMRPETLQRLLAMGGDGRQRRTFVQSASAGMSAGAVVDLVRAAAEASNEALSNGLVRLLTKLAAHADAGAATVQPLADSALRLQIERLTYGCALPDPNPSDYTEMLQRITHGATVRAPELAESTRGLADPVRLLQTCLEIEHDGPTLWRALATAVEEGELTRVIEILGPARVRDSLEDRTWHALVSADTVRELLRRVPADLASVDALLPHLPGDALEPLFDVLVESEDRHLRRAAFDRLRRRGRDAAERALTRMNDERWYVQRNLLALLAEVEAVPAGCDPSPWLAHGDARVRREALRVALRLDSFRDRALPAALADSDERVLRMALAAALDHSSPAVTRRLAELAAQDTMPDELRAAAIAALARASRQPGTLELLMRIACGDGRLAWWPGARVPRGQTVVAALTALAEHWPHEPRAAALVRRAAASPHPEIRLAVKAATP